MTEYCIECGKVLQPALAQCSACGTAVLRAKLPTLPPIEIPVGAPLIPLPVCCCCLNPAERLAKHKHKVWIAGGYDKYATFTIPWCNACYRRFRIGEWKGKGALAVSAILGYWVGQRLDTAGWSLPACVTVGLVVGLAFCVGIVFLLDKLGVNRRGHVPGCIGFADARQSTRTENGKEISYYELSFWNPEFARRMASIYSPGTTGGADPH